MRRILESVLGAVMVLAGTWTGLSSAPEIGMTTLLLVIVLVGVGGFFVSKSLMADAVKGTIEIIRAWKNS